jgi:outer membrane murein-binding lipoprotein Lpp
LPRDTAHSSATLANMTRRMLRLAAICASALVLGAATGCLNPRTQAATAQALNDAATEIDGLKGDVAQVQSDLDSLRQVVAHQDTVINRLAALNNVPR